LTPHRLFADALSLGERRIIEVFKD
jgi:hypothetical protein